MDIIMLQAKQFQKSMEKKGLWNVVKPLVQQSSAENAGQEDMVTFVELLDENLSPEERLRVMEELGCGKSWANKAQYRSFYKEHADKPLEERVRLFAETDYPGNTVVLNGDNTLSVSWAYGQEDDYVCVCSCKTMKKMKTRDSVSPTFCACCSGNIKALLQTALGVKLNLKAVVSSVVSTGGKKRCEFLFDIAEN